MPRKTKGQDITKLKPPKASSNIVQIPKAQYEKVMLDYNKLQMSNTELKMLIKNIYNMIQGNIISVPEKNNGKEKTDE